MSPSVFAIDKYTSKCCVYFAIAYMLCTFQTTKMARMARIRECHVPSSSQSILENDFPFAKMVSRTFPEKKKKNGWKTIYSSRCVLPFLYGRAVVVFFELEDEEEREGGGGGDLDDAVNVQNRRLWCTTQHSAYQPPTQAAH